jgi:mono/diheme cytochrome c family protein
LPLPGSFRATPPDRAIGDELRNFSGGPAFDLRRLRPDEHDRFVQSVISGKDNMPSWYGVLKMEEIEAIWAYIRATVDR